MPRVVHFELPLKETARGTQFYADVFGWQVHKWDGPQDYWLVQTGDATQPGIDGGMSAPSDQIGFNSTIVVIDVPDVDAYLAKVTDHGGTVAMPKMPIPGVGYLAYVKDTEDNVIGMMQRDTNA